MAVFRPANRISPENPENRAVNRYVLSTLNSLLFTLKKRCPMATIYTVSQLNNEIKDLLDAVPGYRNLLVQGEISNYKAHSSGHHYLTLKDRDAAINAVMFRSDAMRLKFRLENGMKVIVRARVSSFPRTGAVQLYISEIIPDGAGALNVAFEQLKAKLAAEGLFAESRKKPIPPCPMSIALVTSPTGAAVRDMIRILGRRWPLAKVVLYPAQVQGQGAAESIARAIALANAIGEADVILCGRGGGSMEDLWAFNEEITARAIFASEIPVISAVGHETDFTIADFVADLRAPTPSAAAEIAVPSSLELRNRLKTDISRISIAAAKQIESRRLKLSGMKLKKPSERIQENSQRLDNAARRMEQSFKLKIESKRRILGIAAGKIDAMSPLKVLSRGYTIPEKDGKVIRSVEEMTPGMEFKLKMSDGEAECAVKG